VDGAVVPVVRTGVDPLATPVVTLGPAVAEPPVAACLLKGEVSRESVRGFEDRASFMAPPVDVDVVDGPWVAIGSVPGTCAGCEAGALRPDVVPRLEAPGVAVLLDATGEVDMDTGRVEDFRAAAAAEADAEGLRADELDLRTDAIAARAEESAPPSRGTDEICSWRAEVIGAEDIGVAADDNSEGDTGAEEIGAVVTGAEASASLVIGA